MISITINKDQINEFNENGFLVLDNFINKNFVIKLLERIDPLFNGEFETGMMAAGRSGEIEILNRKNVYPNSFGLFYSAITDYLGWKHHCDEGIIMGLASYGDYSAKIPGKDRSYISVFEEILIGGSQIKMRRIFLKLLR